MYIHTAVFFIYIHRVYDNTQTLAKLHRCLTIMQFVQTQCPIKAQGRSLKAELACLLILTVTWFLGVVYICMQGLHLENHSRGGVYNFIRVR